MDYLTLNHNKVLDLLPDRSVYAHKGNFGKILLLCGSRGYTGAAALAAMGALRTGAGLVFLAVPESIYEIEAIKLNEAIVQPLPDEKGMFSEAAVGSIIPMLDGKDAVLIGPGIGQSNGTFEVVKTVLKAFRGPVVLDADGINVMSKHKDILRERTSPTILTPHVGEFSRFTGDLNGERSVMAENLAIDLGCIVLLKGHKTIITDGIRTYCNHTGNPGMATGGSGDVLAGIIVSLLGQKLQPLEAATCGAWLHGAAGDICAKEIGEYGMLAVLPRLLK